MWTMQHGSGHRPLAEAEQHIVTAGRFPRVLEQLERLLDALDAMPYLRNLRQIGGAQRRLDDVGTVARRNRAGGRRGGRPSVTR